MTQGFASDINGDDTVMDEPEATLSIDISQLPTRQALGIARAAGFDQFADYSVGALVKGDVDTDYIEHINDAEFHIPVEAAITALEELGIVTDTPTDEDQDA